MQSVPIIPPNAIVANGAEQTASAQPRGRQETQSDPEILPLDAQDHFTPIPHSALSPQSPFPTPTSYAESEPCEHFSTQWTQSLRLLHHYSTEVYQTLSRDPAVAELWKTSVPEAAFSHEFLLHGLLAVSALHYAHTRPEKKREYVLVSTHYQSLALRYFTAHLNDINSQNFEPFFFLATFIFLLTMWSIANPQDPENGNTGADVAHSFGLLQGIKSIIAVKPMEDWSPDGPLAPLVYTWDPITEPIDGPFQARMDQLCVLARGLTPTMEVINTQSACMLAIESLRNTYFASTSTEVAIGARRVWMWPITLTQFFIQLIGEDHPVALIILAHYAAVARTFEHPSWVNKGWSANVLQIAERSLEPKWREWIEWPKMSMENCVDVNDMSMSPNI